MVLCWKTNPCSELRRKDSHSLFKFYTGRNYAYYETALFGKRADSAVYISISMATKSGKAKSKSRYTGVQTILEEIDRKSETDCCRTIHLVIPKWRNIF